MSSDLHRPDDLGISGTTTEITRQIVADLVVARIGVRVEQLPRHEDEAGRTEAALKGTGVDESLLHGIERLAAFHGLDRRTFNESGEIEAPRHRLAVDQDGAAAAQALAATFARAEQIEALLQQLDERDLGFDLGGN